MNNSDKQNAEKILEEHMKIWDLELDGEQFFTDWSLLQPVRYKQLPCMLKIAMEAEEKKGALPMVWWDGSGAAKVYKHDEDGLLLERINGECSLIEMVNTGLDDEATRILCNVAKKLHVPKLSQPNFELISLEEWFKDLWPGALKYGGIIADCAAIARQMLDSQETLAVLHGDLHHQNVLYSGDRGWLVIDPKRICGDPAFDYANIFCNPNKEIALSPVRFQERMKIICEETGLHPVRLMKWTAAWCGLSASWILDAPSGDETPDIDLGVARLSLQMINHLQTSSELTV